jgi:hypothetical protein
MTEYNLDDLTKRVLAKQEVTAEEYKVVIDSIRKGRTTASATKKAKSTAITDDELDKLFD